MTRTTGRPFDPRPLPHRPWRWVWALAAVAILMIGDWQLTVALTPPKPIDPKALAKLQEAAFANAEVPPGYAHGVSVPIIVETGETLETAIARSGVSQDEARQVVRVLASTMDTVNIRAGLTLEAAIARPKGEAGPARLMGLSLRRNPFTAVSISRTFDGALRLREIEEQVRSEEAVGRGEIQGSLYDSAAKLGANGEITAQMVKLFSHKIDFDRDLKAGDPFELVFDRDVTENGHTVETGELQYAEIKGVKFYRFQRQSGVEYFDELGKNIRGFLLRTPVDGAHMTSGFGMRRHPILGFNRMHQGIDFGAGTGTPVLAAGDGVVVEAKRWGGYGNWLRISHGNGWETGYAHLSRYDKGVKPGQRVHQGQVVAYVGTTGMSTGAHLHYEIWRAGQRVNPSSTKVPQGTELAGAELAAFKVQRARLDQLVAGKIPGHDGGEVLARLGPTGRAPSLRR